MMNINVVSQEIIKPSSPTPSHLRDLQASLFDLVNSPTLMPLVFFYSKSNNANLGTTNEVLDRLKGSLPNTLSMFYPLAGRLHDASTFICNDEGVPYVQAVVDKPLEEVVHRVQVRDLDKLLPSYGHQGFTTLLLAIQVNSFACGGVAIGVKMNHAISDAFSLSMFVKTWASMANNGKSRREQLNTYPNFEISKLFPPSPNKKIFGNQNTELIKHRPITKWFAFDEAKIIDMRSKLAADTRPCTNNRSDNNNGGYESGGSSLGMVLSAFISSRVKVACHNNIDKDIPHHVFQSVNMRSTLRVPSENSYYFGNVFVNAIAKLTMVIDDNNNNNNYSMMNEFLEKMKKSVAKINNDNGFIREMQEGKESLRFIEEHFERERKGEIVSLGFSNVRSLPVYEADFGWGKPVWVTSATIMYKNVIILIPWSSTSKDMVAYVNLSYEDMAKLESDTLFNSFVSKVHVIENISKSRL